MKIVATGSAVPDLIVGNQELTGFLDTSDQWIRERTGIEQRRIHQGDLEMLAARAAQNALAAAGLSAGQLDLILCSNVHSRYLTPSLSSVVQGLIGASCPCLDINGACAGFVYALEIAAAHLQSRRYQRILLLCAEEPTRMVDWHDRSTCVLFGDAAAAAIAVPEGEAPLFKMGVVSNDQAIYAYHGPGNCPYEKSDRRETPLVMKGQEVYKFAVQSSQADIQYLCGQAGIGLEQVDYFLLHQANARIVEAVRSHLRQPPEKFPSNVRRYGNTSSAGLPLLLDEVNRQGKLQPGDTVILSAFGAGLTTGSCLLKW
ncbi:MAG: ketoacyl-ACP synthase III [Firmicutes bacterium]|nr:ketoacyl-ACP synthase III [Bacillota bacterium]